MLFCDVLRCGDADVVVAGGGTDARLTLNGNDGITTGCANADECATTMRTLLLALSSPSESSVRASSPSSPASKNHEFELEVIFRQLHVRSATSSATATRVRRSATVSVSLISTNTERPKPDTHTRAMSTF